MRNNGNKGRVLRAVQAGASNLREIVRTSGVGYRPAISALHRLAKRQELKREQGRWEAITKPLWRVW